MSSIELDSNNDIKLTDGRMSIVRYQYDVAQRLGVRLNIETGEWLWDQTAYVPYRDEILVKNPNLGRIESIFIAVIVATPGVVSVTRSELVYNSSARTLSGTFEVKTEWETVTVAVEQDDILPILALYLLGPAGPFAR